MNETSAKSSLIGWLLRQTNSAGIRKVSPLRGAIASEVGSVRNENQDRAVFAKGVDSSGKNFACVVVADGIGGMREGQRSAAIAVGTFLGTLLQQATAANLRPENWLKSAVKSADEAVFSLFKGEGGTTMVALLARDGSDAMWVSIGDSRVYSFGSNGLRQLSKDDTLAGQLNKQGPVDAEQKKILQFVGIGPDIVIQPRKVPKNLQGFLALTTDGVHFLAESSGWFESILKHAPDPGTAARRLVDIASWCGGPDNATIGILEVPVHLSTQPVECAGGMNVWDAFGELRLQLIPTEADDVGPRDKVGESASKKHAQAEDDLEKSSEQAAKPKPRKKSKEKTTDDPQLDIKFSTGD